jgi:hypothetical protein
MELHNPLLNITVDFAPVRQTVGEPIDTDRFLRHITIDGVSRHRFVNLKEMKSEIESLLSKDYAVIGFNTEPEYATVWQ